MYIPKQIFEDLRNGADGWRYEWIAEAIQWRYVHLMASSDLPEHNFVFELPSFLAGV